MNVFHIFGDVVKCGFSANFIRSSYVHARVGGGGEVVMGGGETRLMWFGFG